MMTLVSGGPSWSGLNTSWKEIPDTGISFRVSSPFGPLPFRVGGCSLGGTVAVVVPLLPLLTAGVELLLLPLVVVPDLSSPSDEDEDDVRGSGEWERLA